ncbi:hypothetical protein VdG2_03377 [Verticillium dahliae VDG2]|nr:hypothetical protein VdG2_03377 [Verticillium dahliae VDG2]
MLRDEIQASKQCLSLCEPLCAEKDRANTNTNDGPHASASTEVSYTEVPDRAIERDSPAREDCTYSTFIILGHEKKELHRFDSSKNPDESPTKSF